MRLNKEQILEYQQNRPPYLMIDMVENLKPGVSCDGYKDLNQDEWFFKVHWKNDPNMPGMLQIESLVQMSALSILTLDGNKGKTMYLVNANQLRFFKKILPGDRLHIKTTIDSFKRGVAICSGEGRVEDNIVCKANFTLVLKDKIIKINN